MEDGGNNGQPFPSYARLLAARGTPAAESRYSWTIDFAARRKQAREDMQPHIAEAVRAKAAVVSIKEKLKALKAVDPKDPKIEVLETKIATPSESRPRSTSQSRCARCNSV